MIALSGKRVLVVGLARSGRAAARFFSGRGAVVTVTDSRPPVIFKKVIPGLVAQKIGLELGIHRESTFLRQDLIVVSPGVPWDLPVLQAARAKNIPVVPEIEVAGWVLKGRLAAITGTNGKTTTTALLGEILKASGFPTLVGGNIGVPLISLVEQTSPDSVVVSEVSSFQLEAIRDLHPHVAVLLNITPNHLDRHASFDDYVRAKAQIFRNLGPQDYAVLNADDATVMSLAPEIGKARKILFSRHRELPDGVFVSRGHIRYRVSHMERSLLEVRDVLLRGAFNLENILAASAAACVLGADFEGIRRAVREFKGVEHRLEFVGRVRGVEFYNDSKATSVDATAKALSAFERGVHLILGGKDKGAPYTPLRSLLERRVRDILLIGSAAARIEEDLKSGAELVHAGNLRTAVKEAFKRAHAGDVVLLSPACASYDQFEDFEHRGRVFKEIVRALSHEAFEGTTEALPIAPSGPVDVPADQSSVREVKTEARPNDQDAEQGVGSKDLTPEPLPAPTLPIEPQPSKFVTPVAGPEPASAENSPRSATSDRLEEGPAAAPAPGLQGFDHVSIFEVTAGEPARIGEVELDQPPQEGDELVLKKLGPLENPSDESLLFEIRPEAPSSDAESPREETDLSSGAESSAGGSEKAPRKADD